MTQAGIEPLSTEPLGEHYPLAQWLINFRGLFNAKAILIEEQEWYYLTNRWRKNPSDLFSNLSK